MRGNRIDENQTEIVGVFRQLGCTVAITSMIGQGFPDLVVGIVGRNERVNLLVEIKDGSKPPSARKLTAPEQKFHDSWRGQICIVSSPNDAIELYNSVTNKFKI